MLSAVAIAVVTLAAGEVSSATVADLRRAKLKVPRDDWKGDTFADMSSLLTSKLSGNGYRIRPCAEWSVNELHDLQRQIYKVTEHEILSIYREAQDNRRQRFATLEHLVEHWASIAAAASVSPTFTELWRDGLCHESIMWAAHYISSATLRKLQMAGLILPSLPTAQHRPPDATIISLHSPAAAAHHIVHKEYEQQVSCQQCHTGTIVLPQYKNATLPVFPVDKVHPGRERIRDCSFTATPPCGACEGLGGKRWGDDAEEMTPMKCEVLHGSEVNATTRGRYPYLGKAGMTGEARNPLQVYPHPGDPKGTYNVLNGSIAMGDKDGMMRLRYDFFGLGTQISAQTVKQATQMNVGATVNIFGGQCSCSKSITGNFHAEAFDTDDPLDSLNLPPSQGGAAYLGRIRVTLDGDVPDSQRVATADHYLKWAFHFLVDADENSPSFGLPLRLYASGGVRMLYDNWQIADPIIAEPNTWTMPEGCNVTALECSNFPNASGKQLDIRAVIV